METGKRSAGAKTRLYFLAGGGAALLLAAYASQRGGAAAPKAARDETVPVTVAFATVRDMPIWKSGVGSVEPLEVVDLKPRVDGQITRIYALEGQEVRAGQVLAEIDPRIYRAQYDQAAANKARDQAQLANVRLDLERAARLAAIGAGTSQNVDTLKAQANALSATVAADQAQIDLARLNLDFTRVRSPISGRVGIRKANVGAIVHASDATGIITITQMAPIAVLFTLTQDDLFDIRRAGAAPEVIADERQGAKDIARGKLSVVDSQIDPANGQIRLKAVFANAGRQLWPGELVSARLLVRSDRRALTVPASAIQNSQTGSFVYLLKPDNKVLARPVRTAETVGATTAIVSGVKPGDQVVISGQSRIDTGSEVRPVLTREGQS